MLIPSPVAVEPVNEIAFTRSSVTSTSPTSAPEPSTRLTTPSGIPASTSASTSATAHSGVSCAGFRTTVLPQTSALASFQPGMLTGKFHGVIRLTTPSGSRRVSAITSSASAGAVTPWMEPPW